jgi:tape measure domain-containing protein
MSAEDAQGVVSAFRQVTGQSDDLKRAFDRLIQASPQLASVNDGVQRTMRQTAETMKTTQAAGTSLAGVMGRAGALGIALGAGQAAFEALVATIQQTYEAIPKAGDEIKMITARLVNVTGSTEAAAAAYGKLAATARATGAPLTDTVDTFQRLSLAAKDLGGTTDQVTALVAGLQKFGIVSGASPQALGAAVQQMGQALASGRLQGDELRSILENMPELAAALARELGVSIGALRQMGSDGKLTSEVVFPALLRAVEGIDAKFQTMPLTMERAMNSAGTATTQLLGHVDTLLGLSTAIANRWQDIGNLMDRARRLFGGATAAEQLAALDVERQELERERARLQQDRSLSQSAGVGQLGRFDDNRRLGDIEGRLNAIRQEQQNRLRDQRELQRLEADAALQSGREGAASRAREGVRDVLDLVPALKAARERDEALKKLDEARRLGQVTADQYDAAATAIADRYTKALGGAAKAADTGTDAVARFLDQRDKIDAAGRAAELALDPYAAAWEKAAEQVRALTAAMELWEESSGARGLAPARAQELIAKTQTGLVDQFDKLERGADSTDRAFSQFFSNATSGFEDAIVRGAAFGDVLKGLEQDVARLIIRLAIMDPIANAAKGFIDGQGGASGLLKTGFNFISSFFADGGVMTDKGPLPLRRYASGGIADSPQLAMFGEGATPEAYVPLPDGRAIPVRMQGGRGDTTINVNVGGSSASPALIAGTVALAVEQAQARIYGDADRGGAAARRLGRRR